MTVEDIILDRDRRGISELRRHLPEDFCDQAAALVLGNPGTAMIVTGFYIVTAGETETDGPPGAVVMGNALRSIGYEVVYVTDRYASTVMNGISEEGDRVVEFPITDTAASERFAADLLSEVNPSVLIAIERCGLTDQGLYRNMRGVDISAYNAKIDYLFAGNAASVGIGDGGNELGMGNLASVVTTVPTLVKAPCITKTSKLVIASVSNWGGYGLVASLSRQKGTNLLPSIEAEQAIVNRAVELGAVDGMSNENVSRVDGFSLEENSQTLRALHELLAAEGISP